MAGKSPPAYGSLAALEAAVTAAAGDRPSLDASNPDAALLAIVAELLTVLRLEADQAVAMDGDDVAVASAAFDHCDAVIWPRLDPLLDRVTMLSPATAEGLRLKVAVAIFWLHRSVKMDVARNFEEQAERHELLAMTVLRHVPGEGAGA